MTHGPSTDLSEALRWLRERIGMSREQLAAASGVSAVHIKFVERGKRNPSEAVVQRLLPALRVTRADLDGLIALRPWAGTTVEGEPATLSAYSAGVPLIVDEGAEFEVSAGSPPPLSASFAPPPAQRFARSVFRSSSPGSPPAPPAATPPAPSAATPPAPSAATPPAPSAATPPAPPTATPSAEPAGQPPPATPALEAELIELRERYVHLPRSRQEMVLGWLRALDDR